MAQAKTFTKKSIHPALRSAQRKLFWDEKENLPRIDSGRFLLRVMDIGTWQMVRAMEQMFSSDTLRDVLRQAPHGSLSPQSWNFWCLRLELNLSYPERRITA